MSHHTRARKIYVSDGVASLSLGRLAERIGPNATAQIVEYDNWTCRPTGRQFESQSLLRAVEW